jgi:hypothetical protein
VRAIAHAVVVDADETREAHHLEAAAVGQDGTVPSHERVHAAERPHHVDARPLREVVGVREDDRRAQLFELPRRHALHAPVGRDRHERRRLDDAMRGREPAEPSAALVRPHDRERRRSCRPPAHRISIASP